MKKVKKWILMSIFVCSVLALAYPVYAALEGKAELRSAPLPVCQKGMINPIVLYPNPDDCRKFWECSNGVLGARECPEGYFFCPQKEICTFIFEEGCKFNCVIVIP